MKGNFHVPFLGGFEAVMPRGYPIFSDWELKTIFLCEYLSSEEIRREILSEPDWYDRMEAEDWRGLTPLFYEHVNPYGLISIDMAQRVPDLAA